MWQLELSCSLSFQSVCAVAASKVVASACRSPAKMMVRKKIVKDKGEEPSEFEGQVAQVRGMLVPDEAARVARARCRWHAQPGWVTR